jgi:hypothetical protein
MSPGRRRSSSPLSVALALSVIAAAVVLGLAGLNREAAGEPVIPDQVSHVFNRDDPGLPAGLNYDISVLDPSTQQTTGTLPQLGTVELRLALTNDTALPVTLKFANSLQCEFIVRRVYTFVGNLFVVPLEVWRSSYFRNYSRRPTTLTLRPGQTKIYVAYFSINSLNQFQVPPGDYRVYATLPGIRPVHLTKAL